MKLSGSVSSTIINLYLFDTIDTIYNFTSNEMAPCLKEQGAMPERTNLLN